MHTKKNKNRRDFLKKCGLTTVPFLFPALDLKAWTLEPFKEKPDPESQANVNFIFDGLHLTPFEYLTKLQEINQSNPIEPDFYGNGGSTKLLEEAFAKITGKEKAIYLPTGTMANQLAIHLLNENNTKVIVPENSHVFRDEADAAQSVHGKRLIPVGKYKAFFELEDLKSAIAYTNENEVFKSGLGTVVIENPVRRADGAAVPLETIKDISHYCKQNGYKMHLDGARIHLASAYTGVSIAEYASHFDTVYISLYKYLNAAGGAMLCGEAKKIDQIPHQIKILGGTVYQSWNNTAMALHYLSGIDERWQEVRSVAKNLIAELNKIDGVSITNIKNGTNIFDLALSKETDLKKLAGYMNKEHNIWLGRANDKGIVHFTVNESLLTRDQKDILNAWKMGIEKARA